MWETTKIRPQWGQRIIVIAGNDAVVGKFINQREVEGVSQSLRMVERPTVVTDDGEVHYFNDMHLWTPYPVVA